MKGGKDFVWKSSRVMYNKMCCYCGLCLFTIAMKIRCRESISGLSRIK